MPHVVGKERHRRKARPGSGLVPTVVLMTVHAREGSAQKRSFMYDSSSSNYRFATAIV